MLLIICCVVLVLVMILYLYHTYTYFERHGIKNISTTPLLGNMAGILLKKEHFIDVLDKNYKLFNEDRFIGYYEFIKPTVILRDVELIKRITIKDFEHFVDHRMDFDEKVDPLFGRNLFTLKGQEWKDMRSTLSPAFTSSKIRLMVPFMEEVGDHMILNLKEQLYKNSSGYLDVEVKNLVTRYANDVIASCAFGLKVDSHTDKSNEFYSRGHEISTLGFRQLLIFFAASACPWLLKMMKVRLFSEKSTNFFKYLLLDTMRHREEKNIFRPDMIHLLMEANKGKLTHEEKYDTDVAFSNTENTAIGEETVNRAWSDNDLVAQALLFFVAGFESVSTAMVFLLYELAVNPDIQDKLYEEIKENADNNGGKIDYNSIQSMKYLDMVVSETLRLWPPEVSLERLCIKNYNAGRLNVKSSKDYIIPQGMGVVIPVWSIHRDPNFYPNPSKFDPERFSENNKQKINASAYLPFGLGPRNCIGSRFALCEIKVMIYQLLLTMELSPGPNTSIPVELDKDTVTLKIKGGHWLRFKNRNFI